MKHVAAACMFAVVKEGRDIRQLKELLGISLNQIKLARQNASDMIENQTQEMCLERKQRSDCIRDELNPYVFDFLKDDEFTQLDKGLWMLLILELGRLGQRTKEFEGIRAKCSNTERF